MEFTIKQSVLLRELGFVQGIVEKKNTIPVLSNLLIESVGEGTIRIIGTDLDATIRCDAEAENIVTPGSMCIQARKLFDISRLLPDAGVKFRSEDNHWAEVTCERSKFRLAGVSREQFPEIPSFKSAPMKISAPIFKNFIDRTIFAITQQESRYTLSGAKFILEPNSAKMVTTDGHRLAFIEQPGVGNAGSEDSLDVLIPRKTLAELNKLTAGFEGEISLGLDENHMYFEVGPHLLISRKLSGQFPNYEMILPKNSEHTVMLDGPVLNQALRRVALMADDRSRAIRLQFQPGVLNISAQTAEEGEARESIEVEYDGAEVEIGFNAQYLMDFLNVQSEGSISFEFKDGNAAAQMRPTDAGDYDYKYIVMPMRI
jgi:DNA polymerase-3 subunit beta